MEKCAQSDNFAGSIDEIIPGNINLGVIENSMSSNRIFNSSKFFQPSTGEPVRSAITESADAAIVAWYIQPGQEIAAHIHPQGQDTWTILSGRGDYYLDRAGSRQSIEMGDVVVAPAGAVHGVFNSGDESLVFISVVSPLNAGYQLVITQDITP
jgi:quercetin dioxygenase-like cupin family protein